MANQYVWTIGNMERHTADGIIFTVHWNLTATSENGAYTQSAYGSIGLEPPEEDAAIPYSELTPEIVTGWVKDHFGEEKIAEIYAALDNQLAELAAPSKAAGLPWS